MIKKDGKHSSGRSIGFSFEGSPTQTVSGPLLRNFGAAQALKNR